MENQIPMKLKLILPLFMIALASCAQSNKENPKGEPGGVGKTASVILKISLLDGTLCYTTDDDVYDEIPIDRNDKESGLNEALKLMREGECAKLILPNHLAHGLVGDLEQIPPLAILLVDVELVELQ